MQIEGASKQTQHEQALPEGRQAFLHVPEDEVMSAWPGVQHLVQTVACKTCRVPYNASGLDCLLHCGRSKVSFTDTGACSCSKNSRVTFECSIKNLHREFHRRPWPQYIADMCKPDSSHGTNAWTIMGGLNRISRSCSSGFVRSRCVELMISSIFLQQACSCHKKKRHEA